MLVSGASPVSPVFFALMRNHNHEQIGILSSDTNRHIPGLAKMRSLIIIMRGEGGA